ncbi:pyridoxal phosphate-dependent transferase [Neohortaea acidophila]|uniref:Pyridoxal phosphate-dependent transferase n=1 Tax=Neohortaea acidophila TaxID=245834 RepID=A0A6A6PI56_9PEZI|nr:pyridoxal phosphate-dependent transferase [Neohortaea acidophila]KAF2479710.1 pyridoxal phosphate-dependent transferase [Neohortaea acidophila]
MASTDPLLAIRNQGPIECGEDAAQHFGFDKGYRNLNHGSFGTYPQTLRPIVSHFQIRAEARPDAFIRYEEPTLLDEAREAIASYVHAPVETCVFVPNATTGINTILRNLVYQPGDIIIYFDTVYGSCEKTIRYITETTPAEAAKIKYKYPVSDDFLCNALESTIASLRREGKNPRLALFDTIVSLPGVRMPFERLTSICKAGKVLSLIDGAHGVGHIPLDLTALDPDFFVSNCHKWLYVPRGCAVLYVPLRNQDVMRSTLPTSHGFVPKLREGEEPITNPLPPAKGKSDFVVGFEFVGTTDNSAYFCVPAALEWRQHLTWGGTKGEEAVMGYMHHLAKRAGEIVATALGTEVLENEAGTLGQCAFANVRLPLVGAEVLTSGETGEWVLVAQWIARTLAEKYDTFIAIIFFGGAWWMRLSAQVYLTERDFEWAGEMLKEVCERVRRGEWKAGKAVNGSS